MKRIFLFVAIALAAIQAQAQDQTLLGRSTRIGFFVSPYLEYGPLNKPWETSIGGGLGLVLGDGFIGLYGAAGADYDQVLQDNDVERIDLAHGGLWVGYNPVQRWLFHPYATVRFGPGVVNIDTDDWDDYYDNVLVLSPELGVEMNLTRFLRIAATGGYRWVDGVSSAGLDNDDFSGWTGALTLRLGYFGKDRRMRVEPSND